MVMVAASGSLKLPSAFSMLSEIFTIGNILIILSIILLILILLSSYIYFRCYRRILKWYGVQKIQRSEKSLLYSILEEISKKAGVEIPEIFSFESEIPEMFTVGSGSKSYIAISTSLLEIFDELELEALLAHEIGHIKNKDVGLNTVTAFMAGLIMSFPDFVVWVSLLLGFGEPEGPAPRLLKFMAMALAVPPAAIIVHLTKPAKREFAADETSIKLTGSPRTLVKTLEYLENYIPLQPVTGKFNPGHFHLFSTHTQQIRGYLSIFVSLFDTHPRIEDRVENILNHSNLPENETLKSKYSRVPGFFDLRSWRLAMAASLISYLSLLFGIIVIMPFVMKGFDHFLIGTIAGIFIGALLLVIGAAARLSRRKYHLK